MITSGILIYIVLSLYFSFSNMKERRTLFGERIEPLPKIEAFKDGFMTIPVLVIICGAFAGSLAIGVMVLAVIARAIGYLIINFP